MCYGLKPLYPKYLNLNNVPGSIYSIFSKCLFTVTIEKAIPSSSIPLNANIMTIIRYDVTWHRYDVTCNHHIYGNNAVKKLTRVFLLVTSILIFKFNSFHDLSQFDSLLKNEKVLLS